MRRRSPSGRRPQRVAGLIRQVVTAFLQEEARDPRIGMVTVTAVELTADLQRAMVFWTVHGDDQTRAHTEEGLRHAAVAIRRRLGEALQLRVVPEVVFERDRGLEHAARIEQLLSRLHSPEGEGS